MRLQPAGDRADRLRLQRRMRNAMVQASCICACLALITVMGLSLPRVKGSLFMETESYGSLVLSSPALGFVIIGVLAFLLGICVTLLCHRISAERGNRDGK